MLRLLHYKLGVDAYVREKGYTDLKALVAFSGDVMLDDHGDRKFTEVNMNGGIKEKELPEKFDGDEYNVLIVADKYQTGFDQPLLHTMYVDKKLGGIQAVQTLSRLNRRATGKTDTFVMDFVNDRDEIFKAFKQYYGTAEMGEMPDIHQLYRIQTELESSPVVDKLDVTAFCEIWYRKRREPTAGEHKQLNAIIDRSVERFKALTEDAQEEFKAKLNSFRNLYAFLAQIVPYKDSDLEKLHTFGRYLLTKLPKRKSASSFDLDDEVALRFYRLEMTTSGSIKLDDGEAEPLKGPTEVGTAGPPEEKPISLTALINKLNDRFGTDFTAADQLFFDQVTEAAVSNETLKTAAQANTQDNFKPVFERILDDLFVNRLDSNESIVDRMLSDPSFRAVAAADMLREVYGRIRKN